jgi:hypothetical protein
MPGQFIGQFLSGFDDRFAKKSPEKAGKITKAVELLGRQSQEGANSFE